jgi:hypothetical protein
VTQRFQPRRSLHSFPGVAPIAQPVVLSPTRPLSDAIPGLRSESGSDRIASRWSSSLLTSNLKPLTSFIATLPRNSPLSPIIATLPKTRSRKPFVCHTSKTPRGLLSTSNASAYPSSTLRRASRGHSFTLSAAEAPVSAVSPLPPVFRMFFQVPYPLTPLFATLTKTAGVYPLSSHSGTLPNALTFKLSNVPTFRPCRTLDVSQICARIRP